MAELPPPLAAALKFWFAPPGDPEHGTYRKAWFAKDPDFDAAIRARFLAAVLDAAAGRFAAAEADPRGALAHLLLLDQFPRNLFRASAMAYAFDARASAIARAAIAAGLDRALAPIERLFVYLPFEHSEDPDDQRCALALISALPDYPTKDRAVEYAGKHLAVIERFGRFPHRNAALGRISTPEEVAFLAHPGSSF